jgi:hypothetical protein
MTAEAASRPLCLHCRLRPFNRPRGLCWACYYAPGVRGRYESGSKFSRRGVGNFSGKAAAPEPTDAMPGTARKVAVMRRRAANAEDLFHPRDARREVR